MAKRAMTIVRWTGAAMALAALAACGGGTQTAGLAPGLAAQITAPGAQMDRGAALSIVNHYRAVSGVPAISGDSGLDAVAEGLARQYAGSGRPPAKPAEVAEMRISAGYGNFAETFSGWRNSPADAAAMRRGDVGRAGFAVVYDNNSAYGTHWVMVLAR